VVRTVEELDARFDCLDAEARRTGLPQDVQMTRGSAGSLGVVVGHDRSVLNDFRADGEPPYLSAVGAEDEDRPFTFFVGDGHREEP
jgi:hypothetical protein